MAQARARHLPGRLLPYMQAGGHVLDVGCGNGQIASSLLALGGAASIRGVDVLPVDGAHIPMIAFDGEHLPYPDNSFDLVTLIDVLHHTDHPARLLGEAARVSRGPILIKDHYWITALDRWILTLSDYLGNKPYGVALPYNFLRPDEWRQLFDSLQLRVAATERFRYAAYDFSRQVIFSLEPA